MTSHRILSLYTVRRFLMVLLGVTFTLAVLILAVDTSALSQVVVSGHQLSTTKLLLFSLLRLPWLMQQLSPLIILASGLIVLSSLSRSKELLAMRAAGVPAWRFLMPILGVTALIGIVSSALIEPAAGTLYKRYEYQQRQLGRPSPSPSSLAVNNLWLRYARDDGGAVILHAKKAQRELLGAVLQNAFFIFINPQWQFEKRIDVDVALWIGNRFQLQNARITQPGERARPIKNMTLETTLTFNNTAWDEITGRKSTPVWQLAQIIAFFTNAGVSADQYRVRLYSLMASPILLCAMLMISALFSIGSNQRRRAGTWRVLGALGCGSLVQFSSILMTTLGASSLLSPLWLTALPACIALTLCTIILLHREDG